MKRTVLTLLLLGLSLFLAFAGNFEVMTLDIDIKVEESGRMHIEETYGIHFQEESHGIYRDIQYRFDNPNGNEFDPLKAYVENIEASTTSKVTREDGYCRIKLGDKDKYAATDSSYTINYDYGFSVDYTEGYDELYYDLVSPEWDAPMAEVHWSITLPKPIGKYSVEIVEGAEGSVRKGTYSISKDSRRVFGSSSLKAKEGITVRITMEEGYWTGLEKKTVRNEETYLTFATLLSLALLLFSIIIWFLFGHDLPLDTRKRKDPPEGLNPMDVGFIIDETLSFDKEIPAMLFHWAEGGYLEMTEEHTDEEEISSFTLRKLKDLPEGTNGSERLLFDMVFTKTVVTIADLVDGNFSMEMLSKLTPALTKDFSKGERAMKDRKSLWWRNGLQLMWLATSIILGVISSLKYPGFMTVAFVVIYLLNFFPQLVIYALWSSQGHIWSKKAKGWIGFLSLLVSLSAAIIAFFLTREALYAPMASIVSIIAAVGSTTFGTFLASFTDRRNGYGQKILGEALGFRKFLKDTPSSKVQDLQKEDPDFFRRTYPYAFAMGLGEAWGKKFSSETLSSINWYKGDRDATNFLFYYMLFTSYNKSYNHTYTVHAASSGGGGTHVGGGFSGGGGGSW